jgi:hypothetical protein
MNDARDTPEFLAFWRAYPRKDAKGAARRSFARALAIVTFSDIMDGLARYPFSDDPRYRPMPSTWLNQERWDSEPDTAPATIARESYRNGAMELLAREAAGFAVVDDVPVAWDALEGPAGD